MSVFPQSLRSVRSVHGSAARQGVLRALVEFVARLRGTRAHNDLLRAGQPEPVPPSYLTASFGQRPMH